MVGRLEERASQIIKTKNKIDVNEIYLPIEEIMFQVVKESEQSEYRRGIPFSPRKCCGKKVILTPKNIMINCLFSQYGFMEVPVNKGNQWISPAIIANTAPMERT